MTYTLLVLTYRNEYITIYSDKLIINLGKIMTTKNIDCLQEQVRMIKEIKGMLLAFLKEQQPRVGDYTDEQWESSKENTHLTIKMLRDAETIATNVKGMIV